jgi:hypothetical protein
LICEEGCPLTDEKVSLCSKGETEEHSKIYEYELVLTNWFSANYVNTDNEQEGLQRATDETRPGFIFAWQDQE